MDLLPEEVLVQIFKHLSKKELLNLTEISKYFNGIIGRYSELFCKIDLYFKNNDNFECFQRRYSSIVIKSFNEELHQPILERIKNDVTAITIVKWHCEEEILVALLNSCKNIKNIIFKKVQFCFSIDFTTSLPKIDNLNLMLIETDASVLNIFKDCSVRKFYYDYSPRGDLSIPEVIDFLKVQKNLKDLTLTGFIVFFSGGGIGRVIFNDNTLSNVDFRLKRLSIRKSPLCPTIHFNNFLKLHENSLEHVEINEVENWFCANFLVSCKNLTHLTLGKRKPNMFIPTQKYESIIWLSIDGNVDRNLLEFFPNIKYLQVTGLKVSPNCFNTTINCDKLEEMVIQKAWLGGFFKFPVLKKLCLKHIKHLSPEIFKINSQIEWLYFEECSIDENIIKLIYEYCKNIKSFIVK